MICDGCEQILGPEVPSYKGVIYRNGIWSADFAFTSDINAPLDVSDWEFRADLKKSPSSDSVAAFEFEHADENHRVIATIDPEDRRVIPCGEKATDRASQYMADFLALPAGETEWQVLFRAEFSVVDGVTSDA